MAPDNLETTCCVVGGRPAGMMPGYSLAQLRWQSHLRTECTSQNSSFDCRGFNSSQETPMRPTGVKAYVLSLESVESWMHPMCLRNA